MPAIVCELCGGSELKKQDGEYICLRCGTRYSLEEARKLLRIEVTQPVPKTKDPAAKLVNLIDQAAVHYAARNYTELMKTARSIIKERPDFVFGQLLLPYAQEGKAQRQSEASGRDNSATGCFGDAAEGLAEAVACEDTSLLPSSCAEALEKGFGIKSLWDEIAFLSKSALEFSPYTIDKMASALEHHFRFVDSESAKPLTDLWEALIDYEAKRATICAPPTPAAVQEIYLRRK